MTEQWLIEAGLSPTPRETVNLKSVRGGRGSSASSLRPPTEPKSGTVDASVEVEAGRPRKKAKASAVQSGETDAGPAGKGGRSLDWGEAGASREGAGKALWEPSICDLCRLPTGKKDEPFQARATGELLEGQASDPLVARWGGLSQGDRVWTDGDVAAWFVRGGLHPKIARDLYTLPSEVLLGRSAKLLLWGHHYAVALMDRVRDVGCIVGILSDCNAKLRKQIEEVHAGATPEAVAAAEQRASDLEAETTRLKYEVKAAEEQNKELQMYLKSTRAEVRLANKEVVALTQKLEESRAEARGASEALVAEVQ
ncbi:hypothetical protein C4D60_Mb01t18990 [Musa balbisiana]|uniref:Uncharacterized protein n=1 Tax=Musa balbisiana TaxID=52838 RepID=A0A4S8JND8_MUSBA|nr:hypothetical protein C4D60_Mb01t18990 [Musa balbisiana]